MSAFRIPPKYLRFLSFFLHRRPIWDKFCPGEKFGGFSDSSRISLRFIDLFWIVDQFGIRLRLFEKLPQESCPRGQFGGFSDFSNIFSKLSGPLFA